MFSILFSKIVDVKPEYIEECKKHINVNNICVLPWTFATEDNPVDIVNDFMSSGGRHYEKYLSQLELLGIDKSKITFVNPYTNNRESIKNILDNCNGIFIPGGNPEMFMTIAIRLKVMDLLTNYQGIIIGESAGSVLQFALYGLPSENNFYNCNSFYNGFGVIDMPISIDVHTQMYNQNYMHNLQQLSNMKNIEILTIPNDSILVINRQNNSIEKIGNIDSITPMK